MTEKSKILVAPWPNLCDECGSILARHVHDRPDLQVLTLYCPHTETIAMAYTTNHEGKQSVFRWDVQGPIPGDEAERIMHQLGSVSATYENLDQANIH